MKEQFVSHYPLTGLKVVLLLFFVTAIAFASGLILAHYLTVPAWTALVTPPTALSRTDENEILDAYENALTGIYEKTVPSVVKIEVRKGPYRGQGSGFVWDKEGHIVTNFHIVKGAERIEVAFTNGTRIDAEISGMDFSTNLAVLKVDLSPSELHPITLGDSTTLKVGQISLAIGIPFGHEFSMTEGIISAVERTMSFCESCYPISDVIQTDAPINPGNSGGPLLNQRGEVIGVNTWIISQNGNNTGIGFAVSSNVVKQIVPGLIHGND